MHPLLARALGKSYADRTARLIAEFFRLPEHHWIAEDKALLHRLAGFFCSVPEADLQLIFRKRRLLLLYCNQRMSCAFHQFRGREIVLVFPELRRLLLSSEFPQAYAVLAHELGHVVKGHSRQVVDPLRAQMEADRYAADLGLAEELARVLSAESSGDETRQRLSALSGFVAINRAA